MKTGTIRAIIVAIIGNISSFAVGVCLGWESPIDLILQGRSPKASPLSNPISTADESLMSCMLPVGAIVAPFLAGYLNGKIGRKWTAMTSAAFFIIAFVIMLIVSEVWILVIGRIFQGFGVGTVMATMPIYVAEISTDEIRGAVCSFMALFYVCGITYVYVVGLYTSYIALQYCCLVIPIIFAIAFYFMPETPYYFAEKGKRDKGIKSLTFLRGKSAGEVEGEMDAIQANVNEDMANKGPILDIVKKKTNRRALIICLGLIAFLCLTGIDPVIFKSEPIFKSTGTSLDPAICAIITGVVQILASIITPFVIDRFGRKIVLLISAVVMCVALTSLATFFFLKQHDHDVSNLGWLPLTSLITFIIAFCGGFGPVPWIIVGEIFPNDVKPAAAALCASWCWMFSVCTLYSFPYVDKIGSAYVFWIFAFFCFLAFIFTYFFVFETKGLSFTEIQAKLGKQV